MLKGLIEGLIFASPEPVSKERIKEFFKEFEEAEIEKALEEIEREFSNERGFILKISNSGYEFMTNPIYFEQIKKFLSPKNLRKLSHASLEILGLLAYKGPLTLAEISYYRGTNSSSTLRILLEKGLVKINGKKKVQGKSSTLFALSENFFRYFNISSLDELPSIEEIKEVMEE
ncbi:MAG: SMC-Scp complex subunit ScpB [Candidatus Aminicenantia bacterium]